MTRNELLLLIDRCDGYGLVITDYDLLNERIDNQATFNDPETVYDRIVAKLNANNGEFTLQDAVEVLE